MNHFDRYPEYPEAILTPLCQQMGETDGFSGAPQKTLRAIGLVPPETAEQAFLSRFAAGDDWIKGTLSARPRSTTTGEARCKTGQGRVKIWARSNGY